MLNIKNIICFIWTQTHLFFNYSQKMYIKICVKTKTYMTFQNMTENTRYKNILKNTISMFKRIWRLSGKWKMKLQNNKFLNMLVYVQSLIAWVISNKRNRVWKQREFVNTKQNNSQSKIILMQKMVNWNMFIKTQLYLKTTIYNKYNNIN